MTDQITVKVYGSASGDLGVIYYDGLSINGPVDHDPITQPGMGIIKGKFSWLNDDAERRDYNQIAVTFPSEDEDGATDETVDNDFQRQRDLGYVKRWEASAPAIAHKDHASRLVLYHKQRLINAGSGAKMYVGWHGLLAQPGEVIAIRHENPDWDCDLKRITLKAMIGLRSKREFQTELTVEDYAATFYPDNAQDPALGITRPAGTLTLTAQVQAVAGTSTGS
ncbi:MAG: hypothetical protein GY778_17015, partial [bacterium]|nr:hypothetical protein [bacterium]